MEPTPGTVILREGAPPLDTKHLDSIEAEFEHQGRSDAKERALMAIVDFAIGFAAFLHNSTHPMFLHTVRLMLTYQELECLGCQAGTESMGRLMAVRPPSDAQSLALLGRDSWEGYAQPDNEIKKRLLSMLKDVEGGTSLTEAMSKIGARVLMDAGTEEQDD